MEMKMLFRPRAKVGFRRVIAFESATREEVATVTRAEETKRRFGTI
jgi:hypothetical protein